MLKHRFEILFWFFVFFNIFVNFLVFKFKIIYSEIVVLLGVSLLCLLGKCPRNKLRGLKLGKCNYVLCIPNHKYFMAFQVNMLSSEDLRDLFTLREDIR